MNTEMEISNISQKVPMKIIAKSNDFTSNGIFQLVCEILQKTEKLNVFRLVPCFLYTFEKKHNECNEITLRRTSKFAIVICLQNSAIFWRKYSYFKRETNAPTAAIL